MGRVVVVGGGFVGMAAGVRLAKQRHDVVLLERAMELGGVLRPVRADGFCWDGGAACTTLPAVLRDLFRKSGRPLERELDLSPVQSPRRHVFSDGSVLDLPMGSRGAQLRAIAASPAMRKRRVGAVTSWASNAPGRSFARTHSSGRSSAVER